MNKITQSLTLDLVEIRHNIINARQGDQLVRDLTITITNNGNTYPIPEDADVRLRGARPDGKYVLYDCTDSLDEECAVTDRENGIVHIDIPDYLLSSSGRAYLDIGIYQDVDGQKTEVASTEKFVLYIPEKIFSEKDVVNSPEASTLNELIRATKDLDKKVSENEEIRENNESKRQTNYADMAKKVNAVQELVADINDMTGSTAEAEGTHGLVPAPPASSASLFLKSDGSWGVPESSPQVRVDSIVLDSVLLNQSLLASKNPVQSLTKKVPLKPDTDYTLFFNGVKLTAIPNILESWGYSLKIILKDSSSGTEEQISVIGAESEDNLTSASHRLSKSYSFTTSDVLEPSLEIIFEWRGQLKTKKAIPSTSYTKNGVTVSGLGDSFVWDKPLNPAEGFSLDVTGLTWNHLTMAYESSNPQALDGVIYPILLYNNETTSSFKSGFEVTRNGNIITIYYRHFPADANGSNTFKFYFDDSYNTVVASVQRPSFTNDATPYHLSLKYTTDSLDLSDINEEINELKKSVSDGKSAVKSAITSMGVSTSSDATFDTLATNITKITPSISGSWSESTYTATATVGGNQKTTTTTLGGNVTAPHVLTGYTFSSENAGRNINGTMENKGYPEVGSMTQSVNTTITNATSNATTGRFDSNLNGNGYYTGAYFYVPNCTPANIKAGVKVGGKNAYLTGTYTSDADAAATNILSGKTAYVNGTKVTGSMTNRGAVALNQFSVSENKRAEVVYTIPAGYHNGNGTVKTFGAIGTYKGDPATIKLVSTTQGAHLWKRNAKLTIAMPVGNSITVNSGTYEDFRIMNFSSGTKAELSSPSWVTGNRSVMIFLRYYILSNNVYKIDNSQNATNVVYVQHGTSVTIKETATNIDITFSWDAVNGKITMTVVSSNAWIMHDLYVHIL